MSRQIDLISQSNGSHYLEFGLNSSELSTFSIQLWVTKYGKRAIDFLQANSLGFTSFMSGNVYLHNSDNVDRCTLFGEHKDFKVGVVINQDAPVTKILDTLKIYSDGEWEVESITIPADKNYPNGMYSKIPANRFKKREGNLSSEFLRNMKTSSSTAKAIEAITGEELRGNTAYCVLRNTSTDKVVLERVEIKTTKSR